MFDGEDLSRLLNIIVPMAGAGSRFAIAGYIEPKPLIPIHGVEMIRLVIANLRPRREHRFVFVCQETHVERFDLIHKLSLWAPGCTVVTVEGVTRGAAETVLAAADYIDERSPLMIANSDQYVDIDIDDYLSVTDQPGVDGLIMTMSATDPKWSYVGRSNGLVTEVVEKVVVSNEATVGIYNFREAGDFFVAARDMISRGDLSQGEYYVAPVYAPMIEAGRGIETFNVGEVGAGMYGLGTPADLRDFLDDAISLTAAEVARAVS